MQTLTEIWQRLKERGYESDKGSIHSYIPVYEKLFEQYRETALNVLEIGLFNGHSLRMWAEYFNNQLRKIHGIDCSLRPHDGMADLRPLVNEILLSEPYSRLFNTHVHIFDAEDVTEVSKRFFGVKFDVIIDDANHSIEQQLNLYNIWKDYLLPDGLYIIEDVQDIDFDEHKFIELLPTQGMTIIDDRQRKDRYDDVLIIIRNKYL